MPIIKVTAALQAPCRAACVAAGFDPDHMTSAQVAKLLGVGQHCILQHCRKGALEFTKIGNLHVINHKALDKFLTRTVNFGPKMKRGKAVKKYRRRARSA